MSDFKDSTKTVRGHHHWGGQSIGGVEDFRPNMQGSALVRRQIPTTALDAEAGNRSALEPGFARGGKTTEKHFHVHHHYHGGKVTRSKAAEMEMQTEKESSATRNEPYAKGGKSKKPIHIKAKNRGALHRDMSVPQGKKIPKSDIRKKLAHDKAEGNTKGIKRDVFALNFGKGKADGGHIHDDTNPVAPDYATGGTIDRLNCGGALYATGGTIDRLKSGGKAPQMRRIARTEISRHVSRPAPEGHHGLGKLIARGRR